MLSSVTSYDFRCFRRSMSAITFKYKREFFALTSDRNRCFFSFAGAPTYGSWVTWVNLSSVRSLKSAVD